MAKYNVVKKAKKAENQDKKRALRGQSGTGRLKHKQENNIPVSGKRKRKLLKKWRQDQKAAIQSGLIDMEDVVMSVAEGTSKGVSSKTQLKFPLNKGSKLKIKKLKRKGKGKKGKEKAAKQTSSEAMQE
ncbi:uncharacterized protein LOC144708831 [Wolffia australiana]